ncbi:MAG: hypothetical protein NTY15_15865 [Planctomycetota bacterium]|nr:hypothetical protein [Planctomycetota bacterium]
MTIRFFLSYCMLFLVLTISGCGKNHPGIYTQPEVETQVKKSLDLTEIQINADPSGGYSGTGKAASGETYKLKIAQNVAKKELSWKAEGDRGDFREGEYHFE